MTLSKKIICLRKKEGWSQEQLAEKLNVSRQAVSKWESGQSIPDVDKIIAMATLFHVTTDFLLKEDPQVFAEDTFSPTVSINDVTNFLNLRKKVAQSTAWGVSLCMLAAVYILIGTGIGSLGLVNYNVSLGISMILLLITVACGVGLFVHNSNLTEPYEYLEKSNFTLLKQTEDQVREQQAAYRPQYRKFTTMGVMLCILSVIPIFFGAFFSESFSESTVDQIMILLVALMLIIITVGVHLIVRSNINKESYNILLQEKDYSPEQKADREKIGAFAPIYWSTITMIYLAISFFTNHWETSWMIWVFAGIFFGVANQVISHWKRPA